MPSDTPDQLRTALDAVARQRATFRSAVIAAHERARAVLAEGGGAERATLELGLFGGGRIDAARFAALAAPASTLDYASRTRIETAANLLRAFAAADDSSFVVDVPRGGRLRFAVASALAELGGAFGAAATVELARSSRFDAVMHTDLVDALGFELWGKAERSAAPPLVVRVHGSDLRAGVLADFLDGNLHIVLVVDGPCAPAPLVRLITPGTFVLQIAAVDCHPERSEGSALFDLFSKFDGPAVMAMMPSSAACFLHDPTGGRSVWQRLRVWNRPARFPRRALGGASGRQQAEELLQLDALSERPSLESAPVASLVPAGAGDPTDRLATWLLDAAGLAGQ
jgi:hypothetical protein